METNNEIKVEKINKDGVVFLVGPDNWRLCAPILSDNLSQYISNDLIEEMKKEAGEEKLQEWRKELERIHGPAIKQL